MWNVKQSWAASPSDGEHPRAGCRVGRAAAVSSLVDESKLGTRSSHRLRSSVVKQRHPARSAGRGTASAITPPRHACAISTHAKPISEIHHYLPLYFDVPDGSIEIIDRIARAAAPSP